MSPPSGEGQTGEASGASPISTSRSPLVGPSASLAAALRQAAILTGDLDQQLGIRRAIPSPSPSLPKLSQGSSEHIDLSDVLRSRLHHSGQEHLSSELDLSGQSAQRRTGQAALHVLLDIHRALEQKKRDPSTRVSTEELRVNVRGPPMGSDAMQGEDVGLGVKDRKLVGTLLSLVSRWALLPSIQAYDTSLAQLMPALFPSKKAATAEGRTTQSRFEEIVEDDAATRRAKLDEFAAARRRLALVLEKWTSVLVPMSSEAGMPLQSALAHPFRPSTDVSAMVLQTGTADLLSALLRLAMGPAPGGRSKSDETQQAAAARLSSLLKLLSTASAISMLSSILSSPSALSRAGLPVFIKSSASRLLSAQLLRPDGVRALLISTLGGVDTDEDADDSIDLQAGGKSTLQKYEHLARLLGTAPQGLDRSNYLAMVLPRLFDIIDPDPATTVTAPSASHMRAAAFTLTRISEKHPQDFRKAVQARVYVHLEPVVPKEASSADGAEFLLIPSAVLTRAITVLSSLLLFAEPSPVFFDDLLGPVVPQLLSLHCYLQAAPRRSAKSKIRQVGDADPHETLRKQVESLLRTWTKLVDAKAGGTTLARAIVKAERGIGSSFDSKASAADGDERRLYWAEDAEGICVKFGVAAAEPTDVSNLLETLSMSDLAQAISSGMDGPGDTNDFAKLPSSLTSTLRLRPDPKHVVDLLQRAKRKDLAKSLLPHVLDSYMGQKLNKRARIGATGGSAEGVASAETVSILYLQMILQLFEAFGSELLEGEIGTTLTFINFSLSSPAQRKAENEAEAKADRETGADQLPFISATKASVPSGISLFNVSGNANRGKVEEKDAEATAAEDEEDAEDDEELVTTSLSLLLSLLEGNPGMSTETTPMLLVIEAKIERHLDSGVEEIRALSKEARMVLTARRNAARGPQPGSSIDGGAPASSPLSQRALGYANALGYAKAQETYQQALQLLQDPILPVRAHGLVLLRKLVSSDKHDGGEREHLDPALLPAILDIFIQAVQDEESYLYLNAVQGLGAMGASGGRETIASLVSVYLGRDALASVAVSQREVDKRLRVGEALLQVVQRCGEALGPHVRLLVSPLLAKLRDAASPTTLRTSIVSILGTTIEAVPLALATTGLAREMVTACLDLLSVETVQRPDLSRAKVTMKVGGKLQDDSEDEEGAAQPMRKGQLDDATTSDSKVASLRRAALLLVVTMVRAGKHQLQRARESASDVDRGQQRLDSLRLPGGGALPSLSAGGGRDVDATAASVPQPLRVGDLLFPLDQVERTKRITAFSHARDTDAVVRLQAKDCLEEVDEFEREVVTLGLGRL